MKRWAQLGVSIAVLARAANAAEVSLEIALPEPEWLLPPGHYDPPPPLDPETRRDLDTQVEEALNGFIEARQKVPVQRRVLSEVRAQVPIVPAR